MDDHETHELREQTAPRYADAEQAQSPSNKAHDDLELMRLGKRPVLKVCL